jgi:hypothetical protein
MRIARCWTVLLLGLFTLDNSSISAKARDISLQRDTNRGRVGGIIHTSSHQSQQQSNRLKEGVSDQLDSPVIVSTYKEDGQSRDLHQKDAVHSKAAATSGPEQNGTAHSLAPGCDKQHRDGKYGKQCCGSRSNCFASSNVLRSRPSKRIVKGYMTLSSRSLLWPCTQH